MLTLEFSTKTRLLFFILWKLCACLSLFRSLHLLCCCLSSLRESRGTLVCIKWKIFPCFNKSLFSDVCSFFPVFVEWHVSCLSKATRRTKCGFRKHGAEGVCVSCEASLVLNITNRDNNNTAFSLIPTLEMWHFLSTCRWWGALIPSSWAASISSDKPLLTVYVLSVHVNERQSV